MGHLKLKDGTKFPINLSVGDIRDISKRSGTFSKTITLVGDEDNNNLLNHYYDVNVVAGTFDINKLQQCQVIQNGIVILDNAYMQLVEVVKSQTTDAHNQQIEYKVLVKDSVSDFFTKLGNKTLNEINIQDIVIGTGSLTYTSANVVSSFSNTITDGYKYLLPYDEQTNNDYNLKAFHPAIYAKTYFDAIFSGTGFVYEWGNQSPWVNTTNNNYFEKLIIPYNGGNPQIDRSDYLVEATKASLTTTQSGLSWTEQITGFTEVTDGQSIFDPVNGDYACPFWVANPENIQVKVTIDFDVDLFNNGVAIANRTGAGTAFISTRAQEQATPANASIANIYDFSLPSTVAVGSVSVVSGQTAVVTMNVTNLNNTDVIELLLQSSIAGSVSYDQTVDIDVTINSSTWEILPSADTIGYQTDVDLNIYIPKQIKQADFIKSIFMLYNLYAEVDKSQPNKLILKSRDDYYDSGTERDWTKKQAKDKEQTLQFLPELSSKKTVLSYKDDDDSANKVYKEATNETYGQLEFTYENEYVKGIDRKELIFSPTPIAVNDHDAVVPLIGYIPETNIRILVDGGTQTCGSYTIVDYWAGGAQGTTTTTAPVLTHFDDPITPTFDLNFGTCDYYFYSELATKTNNTIFNLYWRRTLTQIDKGKMLTAWFDLNEVDIQSLNLNDKIRIDNSWWHINRVIDYDANERALTKVELISVDEEIELAQFATTSTVPVKPNNPTNPNPVRPTRPEVSRPVKDIIRRNSEAKNLKTGDVDVKGINNVIQPDVKRAIVLGDEKSVEEDGIYTPLLSVDDKLILNGTEITDFNLLTNNFATANLTLTGNRTHDTGGLNFAITNGLAFAAEYIYLGGGTSYFAYGTNYLEASSTGLKMYYGANDRFNVNSTETVVNEDGASLDFRVEGQTDANLFFADASTDRVGVGTNAPSYKLDVEDSSATYIRANSGTGTDSGLLLGENGTNKFALLNDRTNGGLRIYNYTSTTNAFFIKDSNAHIGVNTVTPSYQLDVNGDINTSSVYRVAGTSGFTGTGAYTNFTIVGGIITNAT